MDRIVVSSLCEVKYSCPSKKLPQIFLSYVEAKSCSFECRLGITRAWVRKMIREVEHQVPMLMWRGMGARISQQRAAMPLMMMMAHSHPWHLSWATEDETRCAVIQREVTLICQKECADDWIFTQASYLCAIVMCKLKSLGSVSRGKFWLTQVHLSSLPTLFTPCPVIPPSWDNEN